MIYCRKPDMEKSLSAINYRDIIEKYGSRYMSDMYSAGFCPFPTEEAKWGYWSKHTYLNRILPDTLPLYQSVDCIEESALFHFHESPNPDCPVGQNIHNVLDDKLLRIQAAMEQELKSITLADINSDLEKYLEK